MVLGILSLQGDFMEHRIFMETNFPETKILLIRNWLDICENISGFIIPGGESTTMTALLEQDKCLLAWLKRKITVEKIPVLCTCAGLILLSKNIESVEGCLNNYVFSSGIIPTLDITVIRNWYGRQQNSFIGKLKGSTLKGMFIRAPLVKFLHSEDVKIIHVLDSSQQEIVAIRQGNIIGLTFHPELANEKYFHDFFNNLLNK